MRRNSWLSSLLVTCVMAIALPRTRGDDAANPAAGQADRLRPMRAIVDQFSFPSLAPETPGKIERMDRPIYVYDDPARAFPYGAVWAWGRSGRPAALLTVAAEARSRIEPTWLCELTSIAAAPLSAEVPGGRRWDPSSAGLVLATYPKAQPPAKNEAGRLRQMKELARRFKAFEINTPRRTNVSERYELRLLPQPVLRYSDTRNDLIDGGLFLLAYGVNPEILLAVEASRGESSQPVWSFGFARMAAAELHVSLDGVEVWTRPRVVNPTNRDLYWYFARPRTVE